MSFEETPRSKSIPPICLHANLPSHVSKEAYYAWHERWGPGCKVLKVWQCESCNHWHAEVMGPDPAGSSSGTGRSSKEKSERVELDFSPTVKARAGQFQSPEAYKAFARRIR